jgi:hypothetical protein
MFSICELLIPIWHLVNVFADRIRLSSAFRTESFIRVALGALLTEAVRLAMVFIDHIESWLELVFS